MAELEFEDIQRKLSIKEELTDRLVSRRAVLKAAAAGIGLSALPTWLQESAAWAAAPLGANDGVLVLLQLGGGNDGLNTVVPTGNGTYYTKRGSLAISQAAALPVGTGVGLHPALVKLKARYDAGQVAIVQGVGYPNPDLSHFSSVATWQTGWQPGSARTGWLGRYLDEMGSDPMYGVTIGSSIPLQFQGARTAATSLPLSSGGVFGANQNDAVTARLANGIRAMGASASGLGTLADSVAQLGRSSMDLGNQVLPCYTPALPTGQLVPQMSLIARLINSNLGVRVFGASLGSFDTHDNQASDQGSKLAELDAAIETFFTTLSASFAGRVTVMTFSEFGRRVEANGSGGTDHGTAAPLFVIGSHVAGGLYGAQPSLTDLDANGNLKPALPFHSVYATVLDKWMRADSTQLLGANVSELNLFVTGPSGEVIAQPTPAPSAPGPVVALPPLPSVRPVSYPNSYRLVTVSGSVASYGGASNQGNGDRKAKVTTIASTPSQRGYWLASDNGSVFAFGDAPFHGSMAGTRLNSPIMGMASTASGNGYWLLGQDGGIFSFGDAAFYGSTGNLKLNKPVVAMASVPTGGGYWFVAADGGVFCFGSAQFFGSTGNLTLNKPIVGMASTPTGLGYWLVASDGGVFCFGDALFFGSTGNIRLNQPIVSMAATPTGRGYRFVGADGGVFTFGDATFNGSLGANPGKDPVVGITT